MRKFAVALFAITLVSPAQPALAQPMSASDLKQPVQRVAADAFGNGIFQVSMRPAGATGAGQFTVLTGPANPAGAGLNVLYGQGAPGTSYMIVRDEAPGGTVVDYVQGQMLTHAGEVSLDGKFNFQESTATSRTTTWFADAIMIKQRVEVVGQTVADTRVVVSTTVEGMNPQHKYKVQYLWDTATASDDGPVTQPRAGTVSYAPFEPTIGVEKTFDRPAGDLVVVDNDTTPSAPSLAVAIAGTAVEKARYVCWADAIFAPLGEYVTDDTRNVSGPGSNCLNPDGKADSAVQLLWSLDPAAGTGTATASMRVSPPSPYSSTMEAGPISLGSATAKLTDTATGKPLAGRAVTFSAGGRDRCTEVTNAEGKATCGGLLGGLLGYDVTYAGGAIWGSSTDHGGL